MHAVRFVYLPQWDLEFFKNLARQEFPICMTYAAFSYNVVNQGSFASPSCSIKVLLTFAPWAAPSKAALLPFPNRSGNLT